MTPEMLPTLLPGVNSLLSGSDGVRQFKPPSVAGKSGVTDVLTPIGHPSPPPPSRTEEELDARSFRLSETLAALFLGGRS